MKMRGEHWIVWVICAIFAFITIGVLLALPFIWTWLNNLGVRGG